MQVACMSIATYQFVRIVQVVRDKGGLTCAMLVASVISAAMLQEG